MIRTILHLPRKAVQMLIALYQHTLSPDHGWVSHFFRYPVCRFHPTCSEYGHQAIGTYGVIKGGVMSVWRILRCNPWSKGGEDPVK
jgi:putative membrane protein insertion efficiency factor